MYKRQLEPSVKGVVHLKGDVTDSEEMDALIRQIAGEGGLDFLINNAGITKKCRAEDFPAEDFEKIMQEMCIRDRNMILRTWKSNRMRRNCWKRLCGANAGNA